MAVRGWARGPVGGLVGPVHGFFLFFYSVMIRTERSSHRGAARVGLQTN